MKNWMFIAITVIAISPSGVYGQRAFMDQSLISEMANAGPDETIPILVMLEDAVDIGALKDSFAASGVPVSRRPQLVMSALKGKADATQPAVIAQLEQSEFTYSGLQQFWISNSIALAGNVDLINWIANLPEIERITLNKPMFSLIEPEKVGSSMPKSEGGIEPGLAVIGAPEMWALGYTGLGRIGMTFDTGVWPEHPALTDRFLPNRMPLAGTWFGYDSELPTDKSSSHGTHVSGIMVGLEEETADTIGVAPRAYIIATDPIVSNIAFVKPLTDLMLGYEWSLNPDGDENTSDDVPDVINNSWGRSNDVEDQDWDICPDFVIPVMDAVEAAGIANVMSAGNSGPDAASIGVPHNINTGLVNSFTVGAVNGVGSGPEWTIANFSSRGPSVCGGEGSFLIKPEVSAPGVNVRSCVDSDGYDLFSGTSMAAPHVSGAVLLLKEAFPYLSGEDLLLALYFSAVDQGIPGEDNTFGMGVINVKDAYDYLAETNEPVPPAAMGFDMDLVRIDHPSTDIGCHPDPNGFSPIITVRNNGLIDANGITIQYSINGNTPNVYEDATFALDAGASAQISLPFISSVQTGNMELYVQIQPVDDEYDLLNNGRVHRWKELPVFNENLSENFDNGIDPEIWLISNPDNRITWDTASVLQADGNIGLAAWMDFFSYNAANNEQDALISPWIYQSGIDIELLNPIISFDLFYRKRTGFDSFQDTLVVYANVPCDISSEPIELFRKGGADLYTNEEILFDAFPETQDDWQEISFEFELLDGMQGMDGAMYLSFVGINRRSNNLLIDNINIEWPSLVNNNNPAPIDVNMYPNPARDAVFFNWGGNYDKASFRLHDLQGRLVGAENVVLSGEPVQLSQLVSGLYLATLAFADGNETVVKLVIQ